MQPGDATVDEVCQDIDSQVRRFLEGAWDDENEEEEEDDFPIGGETQPYGQQHIPEVAQPQGEPLPSYAQIDITTASGHGAHASQAPAPEPKLPDNTEEFLNVLRRRALPAEIASAGAQQKAQGKVEQCVGSLYRDRLKPTLNQVQRRVREKEGSEAEIQAILPLCARSPERYRIIPPMDGSQPVLLLRQEPPEFKGWVDVEDPEDSYSQDAWEAMYQLFKDTFGSLSFSGQPQQAARELQDLDVQGLRGLALAELEHIIRLCLGKYRLLVHHSDGRLRASKSKIRGEAAKGGGKGASGSNTFVLGANRPSREVRGQQENRRVDGHNGLGNLYWNSRGEVSSLDDLAVMMLTLMPRFEEGMPLSVLKQSILNKFRLHLNEANFGCSRLVEIFALPPLREIFPLVTMHRNELTIQQPVVERVPPHIWHRVLSQMNQTASSW